MSEYGVIPSLGFTVLEDPNNAHVFAFLPVLLVSDCVVVFPGSKSGLSDQQAELDGMGNQSDQDPSSPTSTNMTHMEAEDS